MKANKDESIMKKVFLYCRKSSEGEDRQMLSIPSQIEELSKMAQRLNINIVDTYKESKSAKAPGRPLFAEMMERLYKGEADGVLCWKLDRLARNPVDGGTIIWAIKNNGIEIITSSQNYSQEVDNVLLMYVEFGMAQKFIDDLGKNAKRGMKTKAEMGWYPASAPTGYQNTPDRKKGFKVIVKDSNFDLLKKCIQDVISGRQPVDVWRTATEDWGLTAKKGKLMGRSTFYRILTQPFYYGEYEWPRGSGNWYKGNHEPMITKEQFDLVQKILGKNGRPVARTHNFDLTGLFKCSICGCGITATQKTKYYKTKDRWATYTYYHCTKKNPDIKCTQKPIKAADFETQILEQLALIRPPEEFVEWAKKWIKVVHDQEASTQEHILESKHDEVERLEKKLNNLLDLRLSGEVDDDTYKTKKIEIETEKRNKESKVLQTSERLADWRFRVEKAIDIAFGAKLKFKTGNRDEKHEVLFDISSNLLLDNKKIRIELTDHFQELAEQEKWEEKYKDWIEPQKYTYLFAQFPDLRPSNPTWLEKWSQFRTTDWTTELEYPEYTAKEVQRFLQF